MCAHVCTCVHFRLTICSEADGDVDCEGIGEGDGEGEGSEGKGPATSIAAANICNNRAIKRITMMMTW